MQKLRGEDGSFPRRRLLNTNIDALVEYFVEKYQIDVPELDEAGMQVDQHEAKRDVSNDPNRFAFVMRSGPASFTGTEVVVEVPFSGDAALFKVQPSTYTISPPQGEVRGNIHWQVWAERRSRRDVTSYSPARISSSAWVFHSSAARTPALRTRLPRSSGN